MSSNSTLRQHALFSPSQPAWLNYDEEEFFQRLIGKFRPDVGTVIHDWAYVQVKLGNKQTGSNRELQKDIKTFIFQEYKDPRTNDISEYGSILLKTLKYIGPEVFSTVKNYINDAVGFIMEPEVRIEYSTNFFGTADAVLFKDNLLRIHDLKTGTTPAHIEQLLIYAALYCLRHRIDPNKIQTELRIYQNDTILVANPTEIDIRPVMDKIIEFDQITTKFIGGLL